ncbi:iron ABC transporter substrate-binding protein [Corynebacterium kutscheri]|uniref:iron-siderophore ABC transporter substrate-binding protein n=1 Tax=Corynebacterium kutscheri TaxID=35755 RepID=UPI000F6FBB95|nr:iron-siderophore ABC transporter substrate-binding protein [Corynebacterium kutscheri]VEH79428.1 iron ABC transporter substrate-binding protein [Corynebacterium kutscheri]
MRKNIHQIFTHTTTRRGFLGLALAGGAAALAACSNSGSSTNSSSTSSSAAKSSTTAANEQRIVVLNTGQLDNMLTLGILPVGAAKAKGGQVINEYLRDAFGSDFDLDSITDCGVRANPELETIASLNPTLICANDRTDEAILNQLKAIAPVVTGSGGGENWKKDFVTIAEAVGKKSEAEALIASYEDECSTFGNSLTTVPTVSFLRTKDDAFQVYGVNSMAGTVAADCKLNRPSSQQFTDTAGVNISAEQLSEADADWLFYGIQDGATDPTTTSTWSTLNAVNNNQAVEVDYESWYTNASYLSATIIRDSLKEHLA